MGHTKPIDEQFWPKVAKGSESECWEWTASRRPTGYGQMRRLGKNLKAHRVSWEIHNGPIPDGFVVMHTCDNPPCVNPKHLRIGSQFDNLADMRAKARGVTTHHVGEMNPASKLTTPEVKDLRRRHEGGESIRALARSFSVDRKTVSDITRRNIWKSV
ncbi:hypothetical protein FK530_22920 [Tsukamurella conjunctivitidis]|uniref:HNH nuclease domain-containing protein n=1 Tax=Tsukamurella conjunctivitidis TaxID=2592068 RepID=A0A5C5RTX8_9ACTN|nr:hypothetical protein FK530_22920 [Tsukamurella conjunctivitidis]